METTFVVDLKVDAKIPKLKHFACVDPHIDIAPLLDELKRNEEAFSIDTGRQKTLVVHRETEAVPLRTRLLSPDPLVIDFKDVQETIENKEITALFPRLHEFVTKFAQQQKGDLGLLTIARLKPGKKVYPHNDAGKYYDIRDRYHLVLVSPAGSLLTSGGETVRMHAGELWWFDNHALHESFNEGDDWRVHVIFDLLPHSRRRKMAWIVLRQQLKLVFRSNKQKVSDGKEAEMSEATNA